MWRGTTQFLINALCKTVINIPLWLRPTTLSLLILWQRAVQWNANKKIKFSCRWSSAQYFKYPDWQCTEDYIRTMTTAKTTTTRHCSNHKSFPLGGVYLSCNAPHSGCLGVWWRVAASTSQCTSRAAAAATANAIKNWNNDYPFIVVICSDFYCNFLSIFLWNSLKFQLEPPLKRPWQPFLFSSALLSFLFRFHFHNIAILITIFIINSFFFCCPFFTAAVCCNERCLHLLRYWCDPVLSWPTMVAQVNFKRQVHLQEVQLRVLWFVAASSTVSTLLAGLMISYFIFK